MSALFNQTNIAPGTAFATGGGGGGLNNPVPEIVFQPSTQYGPDSTTLASGFQPFNGSPMVAVFNTGGNLGPLQVGGQLQVQQAGNSPSTALYRVLYTADGVTWVQANTGSSFNWMALNNSTAGNFNLTNLFQYNNLYPIGSGSKVGNNKIEYGQVKLDGAGNYDVSILSAFSNQNYSIALTQTSGAPTQIPWAKITDSNAFTIAGDANAVITWMAIGQ